jgi:hypothetical protein
MVSIKLPLATRAEVTVPSIILLQVIAVTAFIGVLHKVGKSQTNEEECTRNSSPFVATPIPPYPMEWLALKTLDAIPKTSYGHRQHLRAGVAVPASMPEVMEESETLELPEQRLAWAYAATGYDAFAWVHGDAETSLLAGPGLMADVGSMPSSAARVSGSASNAESASSARTPGRAAGDPAEQEPLIQQNAENPPPTLTPSGRVTRDEGWLLAQNPRHLTLQLLSARQLRPLENLVKRHALQGDIVYVRSLHKGADLYSLIYGVYGTAAEAMATTRKLEAGLGVQPWLRTVGSVQAQIKAAQKNVLSADQSQQDK